MDDSLERNEKEIEIVDNEIKRSEEEIKNENLSEWGPEQDLSDLKENIESSEWEDISTSVSIDDALRDLPEVLRFIQRLQGCIFHQRSLIHKLFNKLKEGNNHNKTTKDACTQTNDADIEVLEEASKSGNLIEDIKKAAENAVQQTGFVYEATSGMYYDYNTGYYYNAELGLYYEGNSGTYYYFDESSKSFQYHSQVGLPSVPCIQPSIVTVPDNDVRKRKQNVPEDSEKMPKKIKTKVKEEGECSESDSESDNEITQVPQACESVPSNDLNKNHIVLNTDGTKSDSQNISSDTEIASAWPPCLRVVVKETTLDSLLVGSLFIVTCTGGTLGREGDHAIFIPDINISKHHARVSFSEQEQCYQLVDLGSRNGTYVDGRRVSVALRESDPVSLQHGTQVRVGATTLECHLHSGRDTCKDCEPGCAIRNDSGKQDVDLETKEARHRSELRRLRKRFGLDKLTVKEKEGSLAPGYQDRAEERRKTVGSQDHNAKTETASVHESIQGSNKGFKMLSKMGWSKGQALGKDSTKGITEPILIEQRPDKAGLGSDMVLLPTYDSKAKKKTELWKKAQKRFQELDDEDD